MMTRNMPWNRHCASCGDPFTTRIRRQRFCSKACGTDRGVAKDCAVCGDPFRAYNKKQRHCSKQCWRKDRPSFRRTCPGCKKRFCTRDTRKTWCSRLCYDKYWKRKQRGVVVEEAYNCRYCKRLVPRRGRTGRAPSICDRCGPKHHAFLTRRWRKKNPLRWAAIVEKHEALKQTFIAAEVAAELADKPAAPKADQARVEAITGSFATGYSRNFCLTLLDVTHHCYMNGHVRKSGVVVDIDQWSQVVYVGKEDVVEDAKLRGWERWKVKLRKKGLIEEEFEDDWGRVAITLDMKLVTEVTDKVLGIEAV